MRIQVRVSVLVANLATAHERGNVATHVRLPETLSAAAQCAFEAVMSRQMKRARVLLAQIWRQRDARRVTVAVNVSEKAVLYDELVPHIEVPLERWVELNLIRVRFCAQRDKMGDARDGTIGALLNQPVRAELKAVRVADRAHVGGNASSDVARDNLVDGVAFEPREDIGDRVLGTLDVLDHDGELHERRDPADHACAALVFLAEEPRERAVVNAKDERPTEQVDAEVEHRGNDSKAVTLVRAVVLLRRRQLVREKGDKSLNSIIAFLEELCADSTLRRVCLNNNLFGQVGVCELGAGAYSLLE